MRRLARGMGVADKHVKLKMKLAPNTLKTLISAPALIMLTAVFAQAQTHTESRLDQGLVHPTNQRAVANLTASIDVKATPSSKPSLQGRVYAQLGLRCSPSIPAGRYPTTTEPGECRAASLRACNNLCVSDGSWGMLCPPRFSCDPVRHCCEPNSI